MWRQSAARCALSAVALFLAFTILVSIALPSAATETGVGPHAEIPILLDNQELGSADIAFSPDAKNLISVDANPFLAWLKPILTPGKFSELERLRDSGGRFPRAAFGATGIGLEFDPDKSPPHF